MTTSVIICTRNRANDLTNCLKSIIVQTHLPDEVIIVDSSDNELVRTLIKDSRYSSLPINYIKSEPGLTKQRNVGIDASHGDIVFFFDDDIVLDKAYIEKVVDVYQYKRLNNVGGVQGIDLNIRKSFLEGKKRLTFYRLFLLSRNDKYAKLLHSGSTTLLDVASPKIRHSKKPIRVNLMSGCIMSYHRKVFDDFRFDENYAGYSHGEDAEFSHRVSQKYNLYYTSSAKAFHNQSLSKKNWYGTEDYILSNFRAHIYLFRKHRRNNPLNYFAILLSWIGLIIWNGIIDRNKIYLFGYLKAMRKEFSNFS